MTCQTNNKNQEHPLAFLKTSVNGNECKLCITDKRFIIIGKKSQFFSASGIIDGVAGGAIGAVIGEAVGAAIKKKDKIQQLIMKHSTFHKLMTCWRRTKNTTPKSPMLI